MIPLPAPVSSPGFTLHVTEFFLRVYDLPFTVENQVRALDSLQRLYDLDLVFPRMDLDEFRPLFAGIRARGQEGEEGPTLPGTAPGTARESPPALGSDAGQYIRTLPSYQVLARLDATQFKNKGAYLPAPYSTLTSLLGIQAASRLVALQPDQVPGYLGPIEARTRQMARELARVADSFTILAPSECTISGRTYRQLFQDPVERLVEYCARILGVPTFLHFCAPRNQQLLAPPILEPLQARGLFGLNVPNVREVLPLAEQYDLVLLGGIDPIAVQRQGRRALLQEVNVLLEATLEVPFLLGTNCQVQKIPRVSCTGALLEKFLLVRKLLESFKASPRGA